MDFSRQGIFFSQLSPSQAGEKRGDDKARRVEKDVTVDLIPLVKRPKTFITCHSCLNSLSFTRVELSR